MVYVCVTLYAEGLYVSSQYKMEWGSLLHVLWKDTNKLYTIF